MVMCALDCLGVRLTDTVLLRGTMALVGAPPIGVKTADPKGLQHTLQFEKDRIFSSLKDLRHHSATVVMLGKDKATLIIASATPASPVPGGSTSRTEDMAVWGLLWMHR